MGEEGNRLADLLNVSRVRSPRADHRDAAKAINGELDEVERTLEL